MHLVTWRHGRHGRWCCSQKGVQRAQFLNLLLAELFLSLFRQAFLILRNIRLKTLLLMDDLFNHTEVVSRVLFMQCLYHLQQLGLLLLLHNVIDVLVKDRNMLVAYLIDYFSPLAVTLQDSHHLSEYRLGLLGQLRTILPA